MKLLVTSLEALFNNNGIINNEIKDSIDHFLKLSNEHKVIVISRDRNKLNLVPTDYETFLSISQADRCDQIIGRILNYYSSYNKRDVFILGSKNPDFYIASNNKILLLSALYVDRNSQNSKLFHYGVRIKSGRDLNRFFTLNESNVEPWFFSQKVDNITTVFSLTNANTYFQSQDIVRMNNEFKKCLKANESKYINLFIVYFLISSFSVQVNAGLDEVDYWGIYPSSSPGTDPSIEEFKEKIREMYKGEPRRYRGKVPSPILVRSSAAIKRSNMDATDRDFAKCDDQLNTIHIHPDYRDKLAGKVVCIIDDYSRSGTSAETARLLLTKAGVKRIIFLTLGKFGNKYTKHNYEIQGDVFEEFTFRFLSSEELVRDQQINYRAVSAFLTSLSPFI
nr:phosphoribosyltransferase [uncultured Arsenicibacter sp.]